MAFKNKYLFSQFFILNFWYSKTHKPAKKSEHQHHWNQLWAIMGLKCTYLIRVILHIWASRTKHFFIFIRRFWFAKLHFKTAKNFQISTMGASCRSSSDQVEGLTFHASHFAHLNLYVSSPFLRHRKRTYRKKKQKVQITKFILITKLGGHIITN